MHTHYLYSARAAFITALIVAVVAVFSFVTLEPTVGRAVSDTSGPFTISQSITAEIAFTTDAANVTMTPSIPGVTGGTAYGSTTVEVTTNNTTGYFMTIQFSTGTPMVGTLQATPTSTIANYTPAATNLPDFAFAIAGAGTQAEFGYSIYASTTADVDATFLDNGAVCGTGAANDPGACWFNASTTDGSTPIAERLILTSAATPASGSTSTLLFQVRVPSSPTPALPIDTYIATATLTATTN